MPHDDTAAFADHDLAEWIGAAPDQALIELDRELVRKGGLKAFIELAWHTVEKDGAYKSNWHIDAICDHLERVSSGKCKRLGIAIPPRHMKSVAVAVMWCAWDWIDHPERRFIFYSYAHNLSKRDSIRCRRVIQSPWYQARWGDRFRINDDTNTQTKFENDKGGFRQCSSVDGQVTGDGADIIAIDDPHNVTDAESAVVRERVIHWFDEALSSRLNDPVNGCYVTIQQRVHSNDLLGHILKQDKDVGEWTYLCLPARYDPHHPNVWPDDPRSVPGELIWASRMPADALASIERRQGPYAFAGQYQQLPAPREGGLFKRSWFRPIQHLPDDLVFARAWDLAASEKELVKSDPDWTATVKIAWSRSLKLWIIVDVMRWREDASEIRRHILAKAQADHRNTKIEIPQDPGQAGKDQAKSLAVMLAGFDVRVQPVSGDKVQNSMPLAGQAGAGNVRLWEGAGEVEDFLTEITSFPTGAHDDMVDAVSLAFKRLTGGTSGLMDFYAQQADVERAARAEVERVRAENNGSPPPKVEYTEDLAKALLNINPLRNTF